MPLNFSALPLEGRFVRLEPAHRSQAGEWVETVDPETFRYFVGPPASLEEPDLANWIDWLHAWPGQPFVIRERSSGAAIGGTTLFDHRVPHRGIEIGCTWLRASHRGGPCNPEAKLLLLRFCFGTLGLERVQLKTHSENAQSRAAILKMGATFEGILRRHMVLPNGEMRDTAMYSVIRSEWPGVEQKLLHRLAL